MSVPDNYDQWLAHEHKQEIQLSKFPACDHCGATLHQYLYRIEGEVLCADCVKDAYGEEVILDEQ